MTGKKIKNSGKRFLTVKVKTARGRSKSSARWLHRQLNDPYVQRAQAEHYRSRAAYKLLEINEKYHLIKPEMTVVDLGAAPGGWTQVLVQLMQPEKHPKSQIIALDIVAMDELPGVHFIQDDFTQETALEALYGAAPDDVDVVLTDMAPSSTGHRQTDHLRIMALVELAYDFAIKALKPGGSFVAKVLQGGTEPQLLMQMKKSFEKVAHFKPPASRKDSSEMYLIARGFRRS